MRHFCRLVTPQTWLARSSCFSLPDCTEQVLHLRCFGALMAAVLVLHSAAPNCISRLLLGTLSQGFAAALHDRACAGKCRRIHLEAALALPIACVAFAQSLTHAHTNTVSQEGCDLVPCAIVTPTQCCCMQAVHVERAQSASPQRGPIPATTITTPQLAGRQARCWIAAATVLASRHRRMPRYVWLLHMLGCALVMVVVVV